MKKIIGYAIFFVLFIIFGIPFIAKVSQDHFDENNNKNPLSQTQDIVSSSYKQGDPIKVGYFIYKILSVKKVKYLDSGYSYEKSDGFFWIVKIYINNINNETRTLDSSLFALKTQDGTTYEPTTKGALSDASIFLKQIQPNLATEGTVIFEVPGNLKNPYFSLSGGFNENSINVPLVLSNNKNNN